MADKLDGVAITANSVPSNRIQTGSITSTQLQTSLYNTIVNATHPKIRSLTYPGDDTAANTGGSQTVIINGTGFGPNVSVYINGNSVPSVTVSNANSVSFSTPALSAATYPLYLINTDDGATAILIPGIQYSGTPAWVTTSPLADQLASAAWSISLSATGDSPIVYSLQAGSSLPAGITLAANGLISGTMTSPPATDTTYNFTVVAIDPQNQDASKAFSVSVTVTVDTQFNYNVLLLHADGTNNGNNHAFLDSSTNNFAITRNGNASQGSFSPFSPSGWSYYFNGSSTLSNPSAAAFAVGTSLYTIEFWAFFTANPNIVAGTNIFGVNATGGWIFGCANGGLYISNYNIGLTVTSSYNFPLNTWVHVAAARGSGNSTSIWVNGIRVANATDSYNYAQGLWGIGGNPSSAAQYMTGYISNGRIVLGYDLYGVTNTSISVPTTPLTAVTGTTYLTAQSNRFIDNSTNNASFTIAGSPSVQAFSPFASTTAYSTSSHGGSAYFDGSGDYLNFADNTALQLGSSDFTWEGWFYLQSTADQTLIYSCGNTSAYAAVRLVHDSATSKLTLLMSTSGSAWAINGAFSSTLPQNSWVHVAVVRSGTTITAYQNGVSAYSTTLSGAVYAGTLHYIGARDSAGAGSYLVGYASGVRLVKGTAVYTGAFTPPTAPLSAVANTQLLLSCTNGQIFDSTAKNVLETVSGAKVNTSIYKYGTGSVAFNGTSDYLSIPYTQNQNFGTGDFTIEGWFYLNSLSASYYVLGGTWSSATSDEWLIQIQNNGSLRFLTTADTNFYATGIITTGKWYHFAASRNSGTIKTYINGTAISTVTNANTIGSVSKTMFIGQQSGGNWYWNGYVDDFRISKGLGRYPYNFTPPTKAFADKGGADTSTSDTYFPYTTLLLPGNGTNNANNQAFVDSSTNNFAITRNGNATQGTFSPFSQTGWSGYFDGTANGFITVTDAGSVLDLTGDFTLEFWTYQTALATLNATLNLFLSVDTLDRFQLYQDASNVAFSIGGAVLISSSTKAGLNSWNHYAITRSGSTTTLFLNGNSIGSASNNYSMSCASLTIGGQNRSGTANPSSVYHGCNAYISNFRIIKGNALYTSNFTPSSSALTAVSNTSLLTLQSNRFIDTSNNALAITIGSTPSIQAFSPFSPSAVYAAANNGASAYFDGTGDYLSVPDNAALNLGTGDFTIECWAYPLAVNGGNANPLINKLNGAVNTGWLLGMSSTSLWQFSTGATVIVRAGTVVLNQWTHLAAVRSAGTTKLYVNGTSVGSDSTSYNFTDTVSLLVAYNSAFVACNCYIADARIIKGTALYAANFTPPTAPLTAISNTQLLLSATNAGITDATGKNVLETVGDAKISTTQSKFGGSSMYFDGTDDRLVTAASPGFAFGTGDFTIEAWIYSADVSNATQRGWIQTSDTAGGLKTTYTTGVLAFFGAPSNGVVGVNIGNTSYTSAAGTISVNTWTHIAFTRYNGTVTVWVNGINVASGTGNTTNLTGQYICVGGYYSTGYLYSGYIDDLRITKGIARYTQNFTPPTSALLAK